MLCAVTFDLWETVIHEDPQTEGARREHRIRELSRVLAEHKVEISAEDLERAHREILARMDPYWGANLDVSIVEQTRMFLELAAGSGIDSRLPATALLEAARQYGEATLKFMPRVADAAKSVLAATRASGLRTALLSNTSRTPGKVVREILQRLELRSFFDVFFFSDEVRLRKPAPEFFLRALARLGVSAEQAVHVGDQPDKDLAGARAAGMWTVYLRHPSSPDVPASMADYTITNLSQLPEVLGKLVGVPTDINPAETPVAPMRPPQEFGKETTHM